MEQLPYELVDLICQWITLKEMSNLSVMDKYFHQLIERNHFYSFCKKSFTVNKFACEHQFRYVDQINYVILLMKRFDYFKRFYMRYAAKYEINVSFIFCTACSNGYLKVAQWLEKMFKQIDVRSFNDYAFRWSCARGHLEVAQWLVRLSPQIDTLADNNFAFRMSCEQGHLEVAKWLKRISPTINFYPSLTIFGRADYSTFSRVCMLGHLEIAKWILKKFPEVDPKSDNDKAFRLACEAGHLDIAEWLTTLCSNYVIKRESSSILYEIKN